MKQQTRIAFIGADNIANAIINNLLQSSFSADNMQAADPYQPSLEKLKQQFTIRVSNDNNAIIANADVVMLAVKPQQLKQMCADIQASVIRHKPLIVSIAAGIRADMLADWLSSDLAIVRCMPNTPALVGEAASGLFANQRSEEHTSELQSR